MNSKSNLNKESKGGIFNGEIVSDKMQDTVVVKLTRFVKHPKYGKFLTINKRVKVHNPGNLHKTGEKVRIIETRPISKDKHFRILEN